MYYDRTLEENFSRLLQINGQLRWLFDYVKKNQDLDFLTGKNNKVQWISVYRGLSRIFTIRQNIHNSENQIRLDAADAYKKIAPDFFKRRTIDEYFKTEFERIHGKIKSNPRFDQYFNNRKEGYFQNEFSRRYGLCGNENDEFVIIDKEAVVGYTDKSEKEQVLGEIKKKYKNYFSKISNINNRRYGSNLLKKDLGNELDFIALDKNGNILLIEYKHGTNTSGIYLSPIQIGLYFEIFSKLGNRRLGKAVLNMLEQKQRIGLINPKWKKPSIGKIIPVLIISNFNHKSTAHEKFNEILRYVRTDIGKSYLEHIKNLTYTTVNGLEDL